jgi:hypothetical protein
LIQQHIERQCVLAVLSSCCYVLGGSTATRRAPM